MPWEFNAILDELLDGNAGVMNEEEYNMQFDLPVNNVDGPAEG